MKIVATKMCVCQIIIWLTAINAGQAREHDSHWPYKHAPETPFSSVISPQAHDANFVINGRPAGYDRADLKLSELKDELAAALKSYWQASQSQSSAVVSEEPPKYTEEVRRVFKDLSNPELSLKITNTGTVITYTSPTLSVGNADIDLCDALAAIYARLNDPLECQSAMLRSLDRKISAYGPNSEQVANQLQDLSFMSADRRDYEKAEDYALQALEILRRIHGDHHEKTVAMMAHLANIYADAGKSKEAETMRNEARSRIALNGLPTDERPLPESILGRRQRWDDIVERSKSLLNSVHSELSKRQADIEQMKSMLYDLIHEQEVAQRKAEEEWRRKVSEARRKKIMDENKKLISPFPDLSGAVFAGKNGSPGGLRFFNGSAVDVIPSYSVLDNKTVPSKMAGTYSAFNEGTDEAPEWLIRVITKYDGTERIDEWKLVAGQEEVGEFELIGVGIEKPYPLTLKGKLKLKTIPGNGP